MLCRVSIWFCLVLFVCLAPLRTQAAVDSLIRLHHPLGDSVDEAAGFDRFGKAIAMDGDIAVIGMPEDSVGRLEGVGSAYVYTRVGQQWVQQAKLMAPTPGEYSYFGSAVDIDGDTIVVGAPGSDFGGVNTGLAYVFVRNNGTWVNQATMTPVAPVSNSRYGSAVSVDGDLLVVGAPNFRDAMNVYRGNAEVFTRSGGLWTRRETLTNDAGDGNFGAAVSVSGNGFVVGAPMDPNPGNVMAGQAYVYRKPTPSSVVREGVLRPSVTTTFDGFGTAVAMLGSTVMVGAPGTDQGSGLNEGAVYVWTQNPDSTWTERTVLHPATATPGLGLGFALDLQTGMVLVGAAGNVVNAELGYGAALVYTGSANNWQLRADLLPAAMIGQFRAFGGSVALGAGYCLVAASESRIGNESAQGIVLAYSGGPDTWSRLPDVVLRTGQQKAYFGNAMAMSPDGNLLAVGAPASVVQPDAPQRRGMVMIYRRSAQLGWLLESTVTSPMQQTGGLFGASVSLSNSELLVGAPFESGPGVSSDGRAYVFRFNDTSWDLIATLSSPTPTSFGRFGTSVSLDFNQLAIGAPGDLVGPAGRVHVFRSSGGVWQLHASIAGPGTHSGSSFGRSVSLDGVRLAVGAPDLSVGGIGGRGAVFVFVQQGGDWNTVTYAQHTTFDDTINAQGANFGWSVSLRYPYMVVGAPEFGNNGAAFGFYDGGFGLLNTFDYVLNRPGFSARFGASVAVAGQDLVVGAPGITTDAGISNTGAVYLFERDPSVQWRERLQVRGDAFGYRPLLGAAVTGSYYDIAYGAPLDNGSAPRGNPQEGSAFIQDKDLTFKNGFE